MFGVTESRCWYHGDRRYRKNRPPYYWLRRWRELRRRMFTTPYCTYSAFPPSRQQLPRVVSVFRPLDASRLGKQPFPSRPALFTVAWFPLSKLRRPTATTPRESSSNAPGNLSSTVPPAGSGGRALCIQPREVQDGLTPTFSIIVLRFPKVSHYPSWSRRRTQSQTTNLAFIRHTAYQLMYQGLRVMKKNPPL